MGKVKYVLIGFGGIAENRIAKEGFACDTSRFAKLQNAELVGAFDRKRENCGLLFSAFMLYLKCVVEHCFEEKMNFCTLQEDNFIKVGGSVLKMGAFLR